MLSINHYISDLKEKPATFFVGICILSLAVMGTSINHAASTSYALLMFTGLFTLWLTRSAWAELHKYEKWMLAGFALYAFSGVITVINVEDMDEYIKDLERFLRFLFAIPIYIYLRRYRVKAVQFLYVGAVVSGPFLLVVAILSLIDAPNEPARGDYHHIIFGSLAMINTGICLAMLLVGRLSTLMRVLVGVSVLMGFAVTILSQSRGVWLVAPVYLLVVLVYAWRESRKKFAIFLGVLVLATAAIAVSPLGKLVQVRVDVAVQEVENFYEHNRYQSSVGTRLAMWEIAYYAWRQFPVLGIGQGDFDEYICDLKYHGHYRGMDVHSSTHNIYMQAMVSNGTIGLVALVMGLFVIPLINIRGIKDPVAKLSGMMVVTGFIIIGLSESWTLRLSIISVFILYLLIIIAGSYNERDLD